MIIHLQIVTAVTDLCFLHVAINPNQNQNLQELPTDNLNRITVTLHSQTNELSEICLWAEQVALIYDACTSLLHLTANFE